MSFPKQISFFHSNTAKLVVINLVTVLVFGGAFFLVDRTFSRVSNIFDRQVNKNMKMAVASFEFGKSLVNIEGEVHNKEDLFLNDPEGAVVARQEILDRFDDLLFQIKISENYFRSVESEELLQNYRNSLENRLTDNVEIGSTVLRLAMFNRRFVSTLNTMEIETGQLIVERVLSGFDATGLHQINALLPLCREQVLRAELLTSRAVSERQNTLLVLQRGVPERENLTGAINILQQILETLTSANPLIGGKAKNVIHDVPAYLQEVHTLSKLLQQSNRHHAESELVRHSLYKKLERVDREAAEVLENIGIRTEAEMQHSTRWLFLVGAIVLLVSVIGAVLINIINRQMVKDVGAKDQARTELADKMAQLENEVEMRKLAEQEARGITDNLEQLVRERTTDLAAVNKEMEAFVYSMSHDLRTPLRGIAGFSNVLLDDYSDNLDQSGQRYLHRIQEGSIRMGHTIDEILDLSRLTRTKIVKESVDLSGAAEMIIQELKNNFPERDVQVKIASGLTVVAAGEQIRAAMESLLDNAWKFSVNKKPAKIEFGVVEKEDQITFFVRDNGVGFNMAYSEKMFGAFQRLHSADEFAGSGIGLALVQRVIQRHGGKVWAEGKEGEGAIFYFRL